MSLTMIINVLSAAMFAGALAWLLLWPLAWGVPKLRFGGAFPESLLNVAGEDARRELRAAERDLMLLGVAAGGTATAFLALPIYGEPRLSGVWMWVLFG